jgi:hypothetical protein
MIIAKAQNVGMIYIYKARKLGKLETKKKADADAMRTEIA